MSDAATALPARRVLPPNVEGSLWILASAVTFVTMTTLVKYLGDEYPPHVQNFYRQVASALTVLPLLFRTPMHTLRPKRMPTLLLRAATATLGMILMLYSYQALPLAEANALSFTRPLWVTLLAAVVLREVVRVNRIAAVTVGFVGVLVILRPEAGEGFGLAQIAALASALLLAMTVTGVKSLTRDLSTTNLMVWSSILGLMIGLPLALTQWRWPDPADLGLLFAMGALSAANQVLFIKGMAVGDAAALAPVDYSRLVLSLIVGVVVFQEIPHLGTIAGATLVVASTLYITVSELRARRRERLTAPPVA